MWLSGYADVGNQSDNRPRRRGFISRLDPDPGSTASAVPASGAPRYTNGMMFRKVCVIEFARIIAAMWIFENMRSKISDGTTSFIDQVILTYAFT
jgi:hypothetical protein